MKPASLCATLFLLLVALAHLVRLTLNIPVLVGNHIVPNWASVFAVIGPAALAVWLWREQNPNSPSV